MTSVFSSDDSASSHHEHATYALGVDGGGTKTLAWIGEVDAQGDAHVVGRGSAGSSNQVAVGVDAALDNLSQAVQHACTDAKISLKQLAAGVFAIAGSGNEAGRRRIQNFVETRLQLADIQIIHDGQAVLEAGTVDGWGVALIAGTGAVAYGKTRAGATGVVGGWGYWFGDEGSAFWLGQEALRAIARADDGRGPYTQLADQVVSQLAVNEPREILSAIGRHGDVRSWIAGLSRLVCDTARAGDEVATSILDRAVHHWVDHITSLMNRLTIDEPLPIALAGGVLCGSELAARKLREELTTARIQLTSLEIVPEPVGGCVKIACRRLQPDG